MPCSRKEALASLFSNVTTTLKFFFLFFYFFSLFFAKFFSYFFRSEDEYDENLLYEEEEEEEEYTRVENQEEEEEVQYKYSDIEIDDHLVADVINSGEGIVFVSQDSDRIVHNHTHAHSSSFESVFEEPVEAFRGDGFYVEDCTSSDSDHDQNNDASTNYKVVEAEYTIRPSESNPEERLGVTNNNDDDSYLDDNSTRVTKCQSHNSHGLSTDHEVPTNSPIVESRKIGVGTNNEKNDHDKHNNERTIEVVTESATFTTDEKFLIFAPPKSEAKKLRGLDEEKDETYEDTITIGSTSKNSSEWRSSVRDSGTDDPFSSSSRRSCPKWESYTVYQKYDEEMMFLDRVSAQKLHETESLKSFLVEPRSISQRIVHKIANNKKQKTYEHNYKNSYCELEAAYVAQICLAWEALNWNYSNFQRKQVSTTEQDTGCPAYIAQQFQQFQVLLQRYVETEPYERGRRPEIYARMRKFTPRLLQVPEYHDYEEDVDENLNARIPSTSFLSILEDAIQTFMNFLTADRATHCQVLAAMFKRRRRGSIDPTVLHLVKKHNKKKRQKLKELQRSCICFKKRKMTRQEEMEILMALIDLKVVSRVLRISDLTKEQLNWCQQRMSKLILNDGKLQRDSSPLFFPAH